MAGAGDAAESGSRGLRGLRVTFIAGGLGKGGAEKQFLYMLRALQNVGAQVQVLALTQGEYHEGSLTQLGVQPVRVGQSNNPAVRIAQIVKQVRAFRPHFIQATHFFSSFYAGIAGRITRTPSIGAIRSDATMDLRNVGRSGPWLLRLPTIMLANSFNARENALKMGLRPNQVLVLHNVIDIAAFDRQFTATAPLVLDSGRVRIVMVGRLVPIKRMERFLQALADARQQNPAIEGVIVGAGPEEAKLRETAASLGLEPDERSGWVHFLGERSDVPQILALSDIYALTSDREGFPNVLLEAMAAAIPIIATPAGETPALVKQGVNGVLVPFNDPRALCEAILQLAGSAGLRRKLGAEGRRIVERQYGFPRLEQNLLEVYRTIATQQKRTETLAVLNAIDAARQGQQEPQRDS